MMALGSMAGIGGWSAMTLDPHVVERLSHGRDSDGNICGFGNMTDYKLAYYTLPAGHAPIADKDGHVPNRTKIWNDLVAVCTDRCPSSPRGDQKHRVKARDETMCPHGTSKNRCSWYGGGTTRIAFYCVDFDLADVGQVGLKLEDLRASLKILCWAPVFSAALGFVFLVLVHRCGAVCFYVAAAVPVVFLLALGFVLFQLSLSAAAGDDESAEFQGAGAAAGDDESPDFKGAGSADLKGAGIAWGAALVFVIVLFCSRKSFDRLVAVLRATSAFLVDVPSQLLQPVVVGIAKLVALLACLAVAAAVAVAGAQEGDARKCMQSGDVLCIDFQGGHLRFWAIAAVIFVTCWVQAFISALSHYATSYAVGAWYFADVDPQHGARVIAEGGQSICDCMLSIRAFCHGLAWHCGSLAFGSLLVSLCKVLRIVFKFLLRRAGLNAVANPAQAVAACACGCVARCAELLVTLVSEHAFVEIALRGCGFVDGAGLAVAMAAKRPILFVFVGRVAAATRLFGMLFVTISTTVATHLVLRWRRPSGLQSETVPLIVVCLASVVIAEVMLHPFTVAARAVLHCHCIDEDHNQATTGAIGATRAPQQLASLVERHA